MLKGLILAATVSASAALSLAAANAMPVANNFGTDAAVIHVAGGCGPGWHRGPRGGCRPNVAVCRWVQTAYGPRKVCR